MKRRFAVVCAAAVIAAVTMVSGCDSEVADEFSGKDTWRERDFTYTDISDNKSVVECYFYYSNSEYKNDTLSTSVSMPAGLTVVVVPKSGTTLYTTLGGNSMYLYKNFPKGTEVTVNDA